MLEWVGKRCIIYLPALVAKLADALDSGSSGATLGGSNPLERNESSDRVSTTGGDPRLCSHLL